MVTCTQDIWESHDLALLISDTRWKLASAPPSPSLSISLSLSLPLSLCMHTLCLAAVSKCVFGWRDILALTLNICLLDSFGCRCGMTPRHICWRCRQSLKTPAPRPAPCSFASQTTFLEIASSPLLSTMATSQKWHLVFFFYLALWWAADAWMFTNGKHNEAQESGNKGISEKCHL